MEIRLKVTNEKTNYKRAVIRRSVTIGRGADCSLVLKAKGVSDEHCRITLDDQRVLIRDLGSDAGTTVDGERIAANDDVELSPGSALSIGSAEFIVKFEAPEVGLAAADSGPAEAVVPLDQTVDDISSILEEDESGETVVGYEGPDSEDDLATVAEAGAIELAEDDSVDTIVEVDAVEAAELTGDDDSISLAQTVDTQDDDDDFLKLVEDEAAGDVAEAEAVAVSETLADDSPGDGFSDDDIADFLMDDDDASDGADAAQKQKEMSEFLDQLDNQ